MSVLFSQALPLLSSKCSHREAKIKTQEKLVSFKNCFGNAFVSSYCRQKMSAIERKKNIFIKNQYFSLFLIL